MTREDLIQELQDAISREYAHWHFYMQAAITVTGLHREEYKEFFLEEATGEAKHIQEFGDLIMGLGAIPNSLPASFKESCSTQHLLEYARNMEIEVVEKYTELMDKAEELEKNGGMDKVHGRRVHIFLEDQIQDSSHTVDHINQILGTSW